MLEYGFLDEILKRDPEPHNIKNGSRYKVIKTKQFIFLDEMLYCAGGTTLDKFLKCYSKSKDDEKFHMFPYSWINDYDKLYYLIKDVPIEAFDNDIKKIKATIEEYNQLQDFCVKNNLIIVLNLLRFYNNRDVEPFIKACLEYKKCFYDFKLDMYKDAFTLSGLAAKIMNYFSLPETIFNLQYPVPSTNLINSIYFNIDQKKLYQYAYQDKIRNQGNNKPVLCPIPTISETKSLLINSNYRCFYCWKELVEDNYSLDRINCLENHTFNNCVISCIDCNKARSDKSFKQFYRESVLKRLPIPSIFIIHEDNKDVFNLFKKNIVGGASIVFHRYHLKDVTRIQKLHYDMYSKTWYYDNYGNLVKKIIGFDNNALYLYCIGQPQLCGILKYYDGSLFDPNMLIENILNDTFWGCVECDIEVPEHLYEYFSIMPPLFRSETYSSELAGEFMNYVITQKLNKKHTTNRKLICTMKAKRY